MGLDLLFLLLPVAALSGWVIGVRQRRRKPPSDSNCSDLSADYFKGLNYLLNEQPDKAIEVFVQMLETDNEAVDVHFALGNLFRRKGETDRAIRIHQNLIARPTLNRTQRNQALYELGYDYMRAGLLDRAENIFIELVGTDYNRQALLQLVDIYEQEKEWDKAAVTARQLGRFVDDQTRRNIAHYYCEQAEVYLNRGDIESARRMIRQALSEDRTSVRASLLEARLERMRSNPKAAIKVLKRAMQQDGDLATEILPALRDAYLQISRPDEFKQYINDLYRQDQSHVLVTLAQTQMLDELLGQADLAANVNSALTSKPSLSLISQVLRLRKSEQLEPALNEVDVIREVVEQAVLKKPFYQCGSCGFTVHSMHWHCPSCKKWNTIRPVDSAL